jgi:hypothetical protein
LLSRCEVDAYLLHAATRRRDNVVIIGEVVDKECFDARPLAVGDGVRHEFAATNLTVGNLHPATESFQELKRCEPDIKLESVQVAGIKKPDSHYGASSMARE